MPRGKKSKRRARERRRQAQLEAGRVLSAQTSTEEGDESSSCSSEVSSLGTPEPGPSQEPQGAAAAISSPRKARIAWPCFDTTTTSTESQSESQSEESAGASGGGASQAGASGAGGSQAGASGAGVCQAEPRSDEARRSPLDQKAMLLAQFMLRKYNLKQPITREDMMKHVVRKHKSYFQEILKRASELMVLVFSIDVKEADPTGQSYVLVSKLHHRGDSSLHGQVMPKKGLLMTILCVIFMKGNCATEEEIWDVLNAMGIHAGKEHNLYGEPMKLITEDLVKKGYLEYRRVPHSDPPSHEFLWGPQAYAETSKVEVLEFLAKLHDTQPSAFPHWYEEAQQDDLERTRQRFEAVIRAASPACDLSSTHFSNPHMY